MALLHPNGGSMLHAARHRDDVPDRTLSPLAFVLLFLFSLTAYGGANIIEFQHLSNRIWFGPANQPVSSVLEAASAWKDSRSVDALARSLLLDIIMAETPQDHAAIEAALTEIAAAAPTSSATWQALAEVRKARGASMESVLEAFRMSSLTGSHQGYFMMLRAVFGLKHWRELPEQDRRIVVSDLIKSYGEEHGAATRYRRLLAAKSQPERDSIRAVILGSGFGNKQLLEKLGV